MEPILGQIILFAGNFAPNGWFSCEGQLLPISQYTALFSLLGTQFGGNGSTTFALPDLRGRAPIGAGLTGGSPLPPVSIGEQGGANSVTLTQANLPAGAAPRLMVSKDSATVADPTNNFLAVPDDGSGSGATVNAFTAAGTNLVALNPASVTTGGGGSVPVCTQSPYLGMIYIIAWQGVYPSRP